jgi:catechol 2,3-dioxygenase
MGTQAAPLASHSRAIDPALRIGGARLAVADLPASVDFYTRALGLPLIAHDDERATLGSDRARPALELVRLEQPSTASPHSTGLFHLAWLHPSRSSLAATIERLLAARWPIDGASDHGVSEALYLSDPDGLGIEIYVDRPRERWPRRAGGGGVDIFTRPLDVDDLLAQAPLEPPPRVEPQVSIGHVHLKVSDVPRAEAFYRDVLGFPEQAQMPSAAFLGAGGYHHHIGLNSWQSRGAEPAPDSAPGLRDVTFELSSQAALRALEERLAQAHDEQLEHGRSPGRVSVSDPDGNRLTFAVAPAAGGP